MVVICIVALLAAIVVPHFTGVSGQARTLLCANNLRRISETTQTWATNNKAFHLAPLASAGWPGVVVNLTGSKECLTCPEGDEFQEGHPVEDQVVIRTSPTSGVGIPLVGLLEGGGYKVLKLSDTQWNSGIAECARTEPVPYIPDGQPNVYWWGYDDGAIGSGDYDFQDLAIKITKHGDGTATLFVRSETAGRPEVWTPDFSTQLAPWDQTNVHHNPGLKGVEFKLNVGGASHYGMNVAEMDMRSQGKIQALDYLSATAHSTDNWDDPEWDKDENEEPDFIRHRGRLNVLYLGGSVQTKYRDEVDPVDVEIERKLWQPGFLR
jgi:prepilin-type processing-associated H-X9-DG protein